MKIEPFWDKKRFEIWEKEERQFLRNLSVKKSVKMLEGLTSPESLKPFMPNFSSDSPFSLKIGLRKRRHGFAA